MAVAKGLATNPCPTTDCCNCVIAEDTFTRANETPLASPWTKLSGTAANLSGNKVVKANGTGCSYRHDTVYPGAITESQHASMRVKLTNNGTVKIRCGMTDDSNYFAAVLYIPSGSCPVLAACARVAGVGCGIGSGAGTCGPAAGVSSCINAPAAVIDEWVTLEVCLIPNNGSYGYSTYDEVRAKVTLADGTVYGCKTSVDGPTVGTYSGFDTTDGAEIDDFKFTYFRDSPTSEHISCPNCNTPCLIGSDDFTTDVTCNWWTVSGSYSVSGGQMAITGSSKIQFALPHPLLKSSKIVTADLKWETSILARVDLGNGYAIFDSTNRKILIYDSTDTLLTNSSVNSLPAHDDAMYAVEVCYESGILTATMNSVCAYDVCTDVSNPFVYLGSASGTVHFDNFVFKKHLDAGEPKDTGCETCDCVPTFDCTDCCTSPQPAGAYLIDLDSGGWSSMRCLSTLGGDPACPDGHEVCTYCESVAGEYVAVATSACNWLYTEELVCAEDWHCCTVGGNPHFDFSLSLQMESSGGRCRWKVTVNMTPQDFDPDTIDCFRCDGASSVQLTAPKQAIYYSPYLTGETSCGDSPVSLTKDSEVGDYPCSGTLPASIVMYAL